MTKQIAKSMKKESESYPKMFAHIQKTYGEAAITEAQGYLCPNCDHTKCGFLPITTKGEECPYAPRKNRKGAEFKAVEA